MERSFLENEPAVCSPQNEVKEPKNLQKIRHISQKPLDVVRASLRMSGKTTSLLTTYHRGIESAHEWQRARRALVVGVLANVKKGYNG